MNAERWKLMEELYHAAVSRSDDERVTFLKQACGDDLELLAEVRALVTNESATTQFLAGHAVDAAAPLLAAHFRARQLDSETEVGPYRVIEKIGAGGMGEVYKALDTRLGRQVALKVLAPFLAEGAENRHRLQLEARAVSALNHPNICTLFDVGEHCGEPYLVMELLEGHSLRDDLCGKPLFLDRVIAIGTQIAEGLAVAHAKGIVHRDIKPGNIFVTDQGVAKILDFGLALTGYDEVPLNPFETGAATDGPVSIPRGTLGYMSPEQLRGHKVNARTDIFSFGVFLYEISTGLAPFRGSTMAEVVRSTLYDPLVPPSAINPALPADLESIIVTALEKDQYKRRQTMAEVSRALAALLRPVTASDSARCRTFGRENDIAEVARYLEEGSRLITITGPGGCGKTTLAREMAVRFGNSFDETLFVELAAIRDPRLLGPSIVHAIKSEHAEISTLGDIASRFQTKRALLVLDNFEQVLAAADTVSELLGACQGLAVIVTSRTPLEVSFEREFRLSPLEIPKAKISADLRDLAQIASVSLFVSRARDANPDFVLSRTNAQAVTEICIRLDGIPLALELCAARARFSPADKILEHIERVSVGLGGSGLGPSRHDTVRAAIGWSYDLLARDERRVFEMLSAFAGGCTIDSAEVVAKAAGIDAAIFGIIESLTRNSLVIRLDTSDGTRFQMLTPIREFGLERLEMADHGATVHRAHGRYYLEFAERVRPKLTYADRNIWLDRLEMEHDNSRAAYEWFCLERDAEAALRLGAALWPFWEERGYVAEGRRRLAESLQIRYSDKYGMNARVLSNGLKAAGFLADAEGDYAVARLYMEQDLEMQRRSDDPRAVAIALNNVGIIALREGDFECARSTYEECLSSFQRLGNSHGVAGILNNLGHILLQEDDHAGARDRYEEALKIYRKSGDQRNTAWTLSNLADAATAAEDYRSARELYSSSLRLFRETDDKAGVASVSVDLGNVHREIGSERQASRNYREALAVYRETSDSRGCARVLESCSEVAAAHRQERMALRLAAAAASIRVASGAPLLRRQGDRRRRRTAEMRGRLGIEAETIWLEGQAMAIEQALESALAVLDSLGTDNQLSGV